MPRPKSRPADAEPPLITELRSAIADSGQTLYGLARDAGVGEPGLRRFVSRERSLSLGSAALLCQALGLKLIRSSKLRAKAAAVSAKKPAG